MAPHADQRLLSLEMARSGVAAEPYELTADVIDGPSFLVYYSPAFVSLAAHDEDSTLAALKMLAEVYRAARALWRPSTANAGKVVTVHTVSEIMGEYALGTLWLIEKKSDAEAMVVQAALADLPHYAKALGSSRPTAVPLSFFPAHFKPSVLDAPAGAGGGGGAAG